MCCLKETGHVPTFFQNEPQDTGEWLDRILGFNLDAMKK